MSDADDLLKLKKLLDDGVITEDEFEVEKAWILGTSSQLILREAKELAPDPETEEDEEQEQAIIASTLLSMEIPTEDKKTAPEQNDTQTIGNAPAADASAIDAFEESVPEEAVITVDQVMKSAAAGEMPADKTDEEKRAEDAAAAGIVMQEPAGQDTEEHPAADTKIRPAAVTEVHSTAGREDPKETEKAESVDTNHKEKTDHSDETTEQEGGQLRNHFGVKIAALVLSLPVLNLFGLIFVLLKKPFSRVVNILLTVWNAVWTIVVIAVFSIMLYSALTGGKAVSPGQDQTANGREAMAESDAAASAAEGSSETEDLSYDEFLADLNSAMQASYGDHFTIEDNGKILTIAVWQDGVAKEAALATTGEEDAVNNWNSLKEVMQTLSVTLFEQANAENPERHVQLNVLNDENTDKLLLTYVDGTCVYDAVKAAKENAAKEETAAAAGTTVDASAGGTVTEDASTEKTVTEEASPAETTAENAGTDNTVKTESSKEK